MKTIATWIRACDEPAFARVFAHFPGVQLWNARTAPASTAPASTALVSPAKIDGLMLTGGSDISAEFLHQPDLDSNLIEDPDPARDAWDFAELRLALREGWPIFGICRGLQVMNVALGGTLHLDVPNHDDAKCSNTQKLRYAPGVTPFPPAVNSSHHQALARLAPGLVVAAWSAVDDIVEEARLTTHPAWAHAVQYHPERDDLYRPLFAEFVAQVEARP